MNFIKKKLITLLKKFENPEYISLKEKLNLAEDSNTSPEVLEKLAGDAHYTVRSYVARNPNCPIKVLEKLSDDIDFLVRYWVARNNNCPVEILEKLDTDNNFVRLGVEQNSNYKIRLSITPMQHEKLKSLIEASQDPELMVIMDA